ELIACEKNLVIVRTPNLILKEWTFQCREVGRMAMMMTMPEPHYTFVFEGILDQLKRSRVHVTEHSTGLQAILHVSINDRDFLNLRGLRADERVADVIDLSTAISIADRWSKRHEEYPCVIHVKLPVRRLALFQRNEIKDYLAIMLYWF